MKKSSDKSNGTTPTAGPPKIPRSQQVVLRKTYKRYLISSPPPVLVIHLKRFQQIAKNNPYAMAFSSGFKRLDDFVAFPEFLDLAPFLAPRREDYAPERAEREREKERARKPERCMYRLYAVVVHIGNMVSCRVSRWVEWLY